MTFDFDSLFFLRFLSGLFALALISELWKRRDIAGVLFLILFEFAAALWALTDGLEHAATTLAEKILWSQIGYIGSSTTTIFFLLFTLAYTQRNNYVHLKMTGLLMLVPAITILLVFTNSQHHLIWEKVDYFPSTNDSTYHYGKWFWFYALYEYMVLAAAIVILLISILKFYKIYKIQLLYLVAAAIIPFISSLLYVFKLIPLKADLTPIVLIFSGILSAVGIYYKRMFDVVPVARIQTLNNLTDGIIVVDMADRIVDVNNAFGKIINTSREEMIGNSFKRFSTLFLKERPEHSSDSEFLTETKIRTESGSKYFEVKYSPVTNAQNQLIGRIFLLHNISIRKNALDAAVESNTLLQNEIIEKEKLIADLDAYARTVAHDLKNPISGVIGLTEFIKDDIQNQNNEQAFELLDLLNQQGHKMLKIVDELLLLSRIRREDLKLEAIDMHAIVNEAISRLKLQCEVRGATFELPDSWPVVKGHPQWIEEVWANLISNGIKYGGTPPHMVLGYEKVTNEKYRFWIHDNGTGLSSGMSEKLFVDFERLDRQNIEGHGLGLSIMKRIIEKLGGQVWVTSENIPGKGCIFSFTLNV